MSDSPFEKLDYIDALRGWAIIGVMAIHCQSHVIPDGWLYPFVQSGKYGVQLFYVISAFTLCRSISYRAELNVFNKKDYFLKRFLRIAPLYYFYILIYLIFNGFSKQYWTPNGVTYSDLFLLFTFTHGWHPETINSIIPVSWSIAVEFTFYFVLPFLVSKFNNISRISILILASMILSVIIDDIVESLLVNNYSHEQQYLVYAFTKFYFVSQFPVFLLGMLCYMILHKFYINIKKNYKIFLYYSVFVIIIFLFLEKSKIYQYSFLYCLLIFGLHFQKNIVLVNKFTCFIGKISFSLYLSHWIIFNNINLNINFEKFSGLSQNIKYVSVFLVYSTIAIFLSTITYYLIELNGIRFSKYNKNLSQ